MGVLYRQVAPQCPNLKWWDQNFMINSLNPIKVILWTTPIFPLRKTDTHIADCRVGNFIQMFSQNTEVFELRILLTALIKSGHGFRDSGASPHHYGVITDVCPAQWLDVVDLNEEVDGLTNTVHTCGSKIGKVICALDFGQANASTSSAL